MVHILTVMVITCSNTVISFLQARVTTTEDEREWECCNAVHQKIHCSPPQRLWFIHNGFSSFFWNKNFCVFFWTQGIIPVTFGSTKRAQHNQSVNPVAAGNGHSHSSRTLNKTVCRTSLSQNYLPSTGTEREITEMMQRKLQNKASSTNQGGNANNLGGFTSGIKCAAECGAHFRDVLAVHIIRRNLKTRMLGSIVSPCFTQLSIEPVGPRRRCTSLLFRGAKGENVQVWLEGEKKFNAQNGVKHPEIPKKIGGRKKTKKLGEFFFRKLLKIAWSAQKSHFQGWGSWNGKIDAHRTVIWWVTPCSGRDQKGKKKVVSQMGLTSSFWLREASIE